jgi:uncharacterized repeat protein (TIGR03803 family)
MKRKAWKRNFVLCVICIATATASSATTTFKFVSFNATDGGNPYLESLVQGIDGNLYGTTVFYGAHGTSYGTVFKISPTGTLTSLYTFCSKTGCTDGYQAFAGLFLATNGNLYGTTSTGGAHGSGTVFKITPAGTLSTLYSFCSQTGCADGVLPLAGLVQGTDGKFYGTTHSGGAHGNGTVFKITITSTGATLTTLYSFCPKIGCADGSYPWAGLVQGTDGNFYGTTLGGGAHGNYGTVFKIIPTGTPTLTTLYSFCSQTGCTDGTQPYAGLIQASDGNFYGTTLGGGTNHNGTVFKITPTGTLTTLHRFVHTDGFAPSAGLVQATDGNFYGTTSEGGANGHGTVFKITPGGTNTLATLHNFSGPDGSGVNGVIGGLVQDTNGNFYGTTAYGGASNVCTGGCGTVFSLSVGLGSFVKTLPSSGKVAATVYILGTNLTSASNVSFNGSAATFTVVSASEIKTTVPSGATTGFVTVTTSGGTLKSNKVFRVLP